MALVKSVVIDGVEDIALVGICKNGVLANRFPLELHRTGGGGGIRKLALHVRDENGSARRIVGRDEKQGVRLQGGSHVLGL